MQLFEALRCGAKTRSGTPCKAPAIKGKCRCRMHGGNSPGAPKGNQNAFKHGRYTAEHLVQRRERVAVMEELRRLIGLVTS
nr:HGGxSTG domain-containing protein [Herminiimonas sp. CN]